MSQDHFLPYFSSELLVVLLATHGCVLSGLSLHCPPSCLSSWRGLIALAVLISLSQEHHLPKAPPLDSSNITQSFIVKRASPLELKANKVIPVFLNSSSYSKQPEATQTIF